MSSSRRSSWRVNCAPCSPTSPTRGRHGPGAFQIDHGPAGPRRWLRTSATHWLPKAPVIGVDSRNCRRAAVKREPACLQAILRAVGAEGLACHAEGRGFESLQPLSKKTCICRSFSLGQSVSASASSDNDWTIVARGGCWKRSEAARLQAIRSDQHLGPSASPQRIESPTASGRCSGATVTAPRCSLMAALPSSRSSTVPRATGRRPLRA